MKAKHLTQSMRTSKWMNEEAEKLDFSLKKERQK